MDLTTKKAADREYVDRFFHGVASKLMMHPYFTKYAKENDMSKGIAPVSAEHLEKVMLAVKEARKSAVENLESSNQRQTAISSEYTQNMEHVRKLLVLQSKLLEALKKCKQYTTQKDRINVAIQDVDAMIKNAYATGVVEVDTGVKEKIAAYEKMLNEISECKYKFTNAVAYQITSPIANGQSHTYAPPNANAQTPAQTPAQPPPPIQPAPTPAPPSAQPSAQPAVPLRVPSPQSQPRAGGRALSRAIVTKLNGPEFRTALSKLGNYLKVK